ncbi:hypothetical protein KCQ_05501 [Pectobacterium atrosepticum ICMP 1526]|uniref:plasmid mobilization relaxosome protein MobC n=1 Tax=Pectobacterium atrosepticum TaxID=29471 RepID=UPI0005043F25|nr:plasmid mobilization relaxosome protein MobC [Pectobacterium atrosepticum]KFX10727.1 relaxosome protein [Pectobacterium atrosepticum]KMK87239.1 hypothetical protein KCQ_05501 [Pectobacterium atrosepticum ICMP 1526]
MIVKENKTKIISFRLPECEAKEYELMCSDVNMSKSDLFRAIIKTKKNGGGFIINSTRKKNNNPKYEELVFYYSKASNNLNQLAKRINTAFSTKIISEDLMLAAIDILKNIEDLLAAGVEDGNN